ncbi:MAG: ABC transporter substrate-binding protein [Chloroflexi bacterium]|nr:ABC transporter substrate-binding protein [Chloroflexota bacterium]
MTKALPAGRLTSDSQSKIHQKRGDMLKVWQITGRAILGVVIGVVALAAVACTAASSPTPEPPPKDPIVFADLSWDSAKLQNRIAMFILERGYGYPVDVISGDTIALFDELLKGTTQVTMEIWLPNQQEAWDLAVGDGSVISLGRSLDDNWQSTFAVPQYVLNENPGLTSVQDLRKFKDLFVTPDSDGKARLVTCVVGWECENINEQKVAAYGLTDVVELVSPRSEAALFASLEGAYVKRDPWLGYMWGPTKTASELDLAMLTEPKCGVDVGPETGCAYPATRVLIAVHPSLITRAPEVVEFLRLWRFPAPSQIAAVEWMADRDASIDEGAIWFLQNHDIWADWVPPDVEQRVKEALAN